jgi:hypothetical protein
MRFLSFLLLCLVQVSCLSTSKNPDYIEKDQIITDITDMNQADQVLVSDMKSSDTQVEDQQVDMQTNLDQMLMVDQMIDPGLMDADGDRRTADVDCNDQNPDIYPNAFERCDDLDNDCDQKVDEIYPTKGQGCELGTGACYAMGNMDCSPDGNSLVCNALRIEPRVEQCNQIDDDCDTQIDEGRDCNCIPTPETCNQRDDDCDGRADEANICEPQCIVGLEICDSADNDCDGNIDEGNVCIPQCQPALERCDALDNDCDGRTDEGVLNACGACGLLPLETCDAVDNDCDGNTDEGFADNCRSCQLGGAVEICNAVDDDCDGNVDEAQNTLCIVKIGQAEVTTDAQINLGTQLFATGDLNGDGITDLYASAPGYYIDKIASNPLNANQEAIQGEVWAIDGASGQRLWKVQGTGAFGYTLLSADLDGDQIEELVVGAPLQSVNGVRGVLKFYERGGRNLGQMTSTADIGLGRSIDLTVRNQRNILVVGEGYYRAPGQQDNKGRIRGLSFETRNWSSPNLAFNYEGTNANARLGERVFNVMDFDGDGLDELLTTFYPLNVTDRYSRLLSSVDGSPVGEALRSTAYASNGSYMDGLSYLSNGDRGYFAFTSPKANIDGENNAGYVLIRRETGADHQSLVLQNASQDDGFGVSIAEMKAEGISFFAIGSANLDKVFVYEPTSAQFQWLEENRTEDFGYAVAGAKQPSSDGTYRFFVGEPSYDGQKGRVHIYSVR